MEMAFELLKAHGRPMHYYELIQEILGRKGLPNDPAQISSVLTQINLDTRFAYVGKGEWGLKVWVPTRGSKRLPTITLMNKALAYDDEDDEEKEVISPDDLDELDDELDEEGIDSEESYSHDETEIDEERWN